MRTRLTLIALLVTLPALGASTAAPALDAPSSVVLEQVKEGIGLTSVGAWATYRVADETGRRVSYVRWAVVGEETDSHGRPARWVELELGPHAALRAPLMQMRFLMSTRDEGKARISRLFVGVGPEKVREVAPDAMPAFQRPPKTKTRSPAVKQGEFSIREGRAAKLNTQAGMIDATPTEVVFRQTVLQRIWLSPQVPFLGLARIDVPATGQHLEVHDFGLDAKPRIVLPHPSEKRITASPEQQGVQP